MQKGVHWSNECRSKYDAQGNPIQLGNGQRDLLWDPHKAQVYGAMNATPDTERPIWLPEHYVHLFDAPGDTMNCADDSDSTNIGTGAMGAGLAFNGTAYWNDTQAFESSVKAQAEYPLYLYRQKREFGINATIVAAIAVSATTATAMEIAVQMITKVKKTRPRRPKRKASKKVTFTKKANEKSPYGHNHRLMDAVTSPKTGPGQHRRLQYLHK
ncbi:hypothetical protein STEG23_029916 [Scotinomys teguina]